MIYALKCTTFPQSKRNLAIAILNIWLEKPENKVTLGAKEVVTQKLWERVYAMKRRMQYRKPTADATALAKKIASITDGTCVGTEGNHRPANIFFPRRLSDIR